MQARRDRIALSCKPLRRHIHLHGSLVPGTPAYRPIAIQFGAEVAFECRGHAIVFRILEGDCAGLENYRAQLSRASAKAIVESDQPDLLPWQCRLEKGHYR